MGSLLVSEASGAVEQVLFYARFGHAYAGCFGTAVAGARDFDGDGVPDFLVGESNACIGGSFNSGSALLYSGLTGVELYRVSSDSAGVDDDFGSAATIVDDLDGDGVGDFAVGASRSVSLSGSIYVYSGRTGSLLYRRDGGNGNAPAGALGSSIAGLHDVDGDGSGDLIVGAPTAFDSLGEWTGAVAVYSGATGLVLRRIDGFDGASSGDRFGQVVTAVGDLNGDGVGDFVVSAPGALAVFAYSGASGALIYRIDGTGAGYGSALVGLDDIDGDGRADFAVGAPELDGSVFLYSGAMGSLIRRIDATLFENLGTSLASCDVNGDGVSDLVVGAPGTGGFAGAVFVYSGLDGSLLMRVDGTVRYAELGETVASAGDLNGDGREDLILGAPSTTIYDARFIGGAVLLYGLADVLPARAFVGNGSSALHISAGSDTSRVQVEPIAISYSNDEVQLETMTLRASDPFNEIRPVVAVPGPDTDRNGVSEIGARFRKGDLRALLGIRTSRADTATIQIEANTTSGGRVRAVALINLISGPPAIATLAPNPIRSNGVLSFVTTKPGHLRVRLYDLSGRLVRDLVDDPSAGSGYHDVPVDGRDARGKTLASGVYFYKIETAEGVSSGRIAIVR